MPFQGNPNAGAPDPALINMLFQQKQRREELQWEREKYQIEAQRQAQLDQADQARKDEIHRLDTLTKRLQLTKDVSEQGANVDSARRNSEQVSSKNFTQEDLFGGGGGADFASVVAQNDPTAGQQLQESDAARAFFASQLAGAMPAMQEVSPGVDPVSALLGAGQAVETQRGYTAGIAAAESDRQFNQQAAEARSVATTANNRSIDRMDHAAEIAAAADVRKIKTREKELQSLSNRLSDPKVTGPERELVESQYKAIKAEANADLTRSQAPEVVTENRRRAQENFEYDQVYDQNRSVRELVQRLESGDTSGVGVEGWASEVIGNFKDVVETASSIPFFDRYQSTLETVLNNPANTDQEKQQIIDTFFSQEVLDRVAAGQLTEQEMRWWFMYSLNPDGRVSNMLSQETRKRSDIIGPGVGPKMALSRLRAMEQRQSQYLKRKQAYTKKVDPTEAFDPTDNRRIGSNSLPLGAGPSVAPKRAAVTKPRMSPQDAAAAIQQQSAGR